MSARPTSAPLEWLVLGGRRSLLVSLLLLAPAGCVRPASRTPPPRASAPTEDRTLKVVPDATVEGEASWVSDKLAGRPMANGEPYDPAALTAANRSLPLGCWVRVTRLDGPRAGASVQLRITDRGPFGKRRRILDVSRAAAKQLDLLRAGRGWVRLERLSPAR